MKKISTLCYTGFFAFFLLLLNLEVHAQEVEKSETAFYSDFYVMQVKPMQFHLTYNYPMADRVMVRILDGHRNVLFVEKALVYKKYHKSFDLSNFADGQYTFELYDGDKEFKKSFDVITKTTRIVTAQNDHSVVVSGFGN